VNRSRSQNRRSPDASGPDLEHWPPGRRRLHLRRALVVLGVVLTVGISLLAWGAYKNRSGQDDSFLTQARACLAKNDFATALRYLDWHLESQPRDVDALVLKGQILADVAGTSEQAAAALPANEEALRLDPSRREVRRRLARLNLRAGRFQTAETHARNLLDPKQGGDPKDADAHRLLGDALVAQARRGAADLWPKAIASYETAQTLDPGHIEGAVALAALYQNRAHKPQKALRVMDELLRYHPQSSKARLARYSYFLSSNQLEKARAELEEAVRLAPHDPRIQLLAAEDALRRGDTEAARQHVARVPEETTNALLKLNTQAAIEFQDRNYEAAIHDWQEALKITGGTNTEVTWRLAYVLLSLGRPDEAQPLVAQYHRLTDGDQPTTAGIFLDAFLALARGRPSETIKRLESLRLRPSAAELAPEDPRSLDTQIALTLGQAYEALGEDAKARNAYRRAEQLVRTASGVRMAEPWLRIADLAQRTNDFQAALEELDDGLVAIPNDPALLVKKTSVLLAQQLQLPQDQRSFQGVAQRLDQAQKAAPHDPELVKVQTEYLAATNRLDAAAGLLETATQHHPKNLELWTLRAEILHRLSRSDQALKVLDEAKAHVGDPVPLRLTRALLLVLQGQERAAQATLEEGLQADKGPGAAVRRALLWSALGDLRRSEGDLAAAREAYTHWAELEPKNPRPRLLLLDLALDTGQQTEVEKALTAIDGLEGATGLAARALVKLADRPGVDDSAEARRQRLDEAQRLIEQLAQKEPDNPTVDLLRGQLLEQRGQTDEAVAAYRQARRRGAGPEAFRRLASLLARHHRLEELRQLRAAARPGELTPELERQMVRLALLSGDKLAVERLARQIAEAHPEDIDTRAWAARLIGELGQPQDAEKMIGDLIQQRPDALGPRLALFLFQLSQRQTAQAAETLQQIQARPLQADRLELVLADCYRLLGDWSRADALYRQAVAKWPKDPNVSRRVAAVARATGHRAEAESVLRQVLDQEPQSGWARRELALLLSEKPDPGARQEALRLIGTNPSAADTPDDCLVRAIVQIHTENPKQVEEATRTLTELASRGGRVAALAEDLLAQVALLTGKAQEAREHAQKAVERAAEPNLIATYAKTLIAAGQPEDALKQIDRLDALEPKGLRAVLLRAQARLALHQQERAVTALEQTLQERHESAEGRDFARQAFNLLATSGPPEAAERIGQRLAGFWPQDAWAVAPLMAQHGRWDEALRLCRAAIDAGSARDGALTALGIFQDTSTKTPKTQKALQQVDDLITAALKRLPEHEELLMARGEVQRRLGHFDQAVASYRAVVAKNPQNILALNDLAWTLSEDLHQPDEGLKWIDEALRRAGHQPNLLDTRGVIRTRQENYADAIQDLEAALKGDPLATTYFHAALAYQGAGRTQDFARALDQAKRAGLNPDRLQPSERAAWDQLMDR
jgi:tetratricopeptide (TPR) repeat protein